MIKKSKIKSNFILLSVFLFLLILIFISGTVYTTLNSAVNNMTNSVELQSRSNARELLDFIEIQLEKDIDENKVNVNKPEEIENWINKILTNSNTINKYKNISLLRISIDNNKFKGKIIWLSNPINNSINELSDYNEIIINQNKAKKYFKNNAITNYSEIADNTNLVNTLIDNKIIRFKNPNEVQKSLNKMFNGYSSSENDNYIWEENNSENDKDLVEWVSLPSGNNGFYNESKISNEKLNPKYSKISIIAFVDYNYIMKPYEKTINDYNFIKVAIIILLVIIIILSLILMTKFVWKNKQKTEYLK